MFTSRLANVRRTSPKSNQDEVDSGWVNMTDEKALFAAMGHEPPEEVIKRGH